MMSVPQALAMAWQHYQAGDLQQAEQLLQQVLQADANQVDALHLQGVIAVRMGRDNLAVDFFHAVLRQRPDHAGAHNNLGMVLRKQGKLAEAVLSYQQALHLRPDFVEAHNNLGNALQQQGKLAEAVVSLEMALRLRPDYADALSNLGMALRKQGKLAEAMARLQEALRLRPDYAEAHNNLGITLLEQGKLADAMVRLQEALRLRPDYSEAHNNLGSALQQQGKLAEAAASYQQAVRLRPDYAEAHLNLGEALLEQGRLAEAAASYQQALRLRPDYAEAHNNLGLLWLLEGNFQQGWPEYEWRWQSKDYSSSPRPEAKWDGSPLDGKTVLLWAEQGVGDTFQFIRYAAEVKERGATVVVECPPALLDVLAGCPGIDHLLPQGGPLPAFDVQAALLSLPGLCGTTLATIPARVPYLVADRSRVAQWQERLAGVSGFKVGICWQGNPHHKNDRQRSVSLARFAPLAEVSGLRLVSLQRGPGSEQWDTVVGHWPTVDLPGQAEDPSQGWVDTAALLCALDLVITMDTAVAHLAGALGMPIWVALPFSPDWRWLLGREDTPWYPSMRLFRQTQPGDWPGVFQRIKGALQR